MKYCEILIYYRKHIKYIIEIVIKFYYINVNIIMFNVYWFIIYLLYYYTATSTISIDIN